MVTSKIMKVLTAKLATPSGYFFLRLQARLSASCSPAHLRPLENEPSVKIVQSLR
jgi:hypothetical protein